MVEDAPLPNKAKISRLWLIALLIIIALGAALRIHELDGDSLWLDEAYSIKFAHESPSAIIEIASQDVHPPLYYLALHYWVLLFGDSETATRLLSALFGILAIPVIYKVASRLFDRATGLLAASLLALSRFHLEFSQEARMYSLLCLLALVSFYFFLKLLDERRVWTLALYILSSALLIYTHVYSFFIIAAQNIYLLTLLFVARDVFKRLWKPWLVGQILLLVLFLPWLSVQAQQFSRVQQGFWIPQLPPGLIVSTFVIYAGSYQLAVILFVLAALAVFSGWKGWNEQSVAESSSSLEGKHRLLAGRLKIYLLLLWLACPIIIPYLISQFATPVFLPKYTIAALPAFMILAARGLMSLRFHQLRMVLILVLVFFSLTVLRNYFGSAKKDMWREAVASISPLTRPNDLVLFNQQSGQVPFEYYYKRADLIKKPFPDYHAEVNAANLDEQLKATVEGHDRVWLVISHPNALTLLIPLQLGQWYDTASHINHPGVEMYLFERKK
jgi:mannosyltransferase